MRHADVGRRDRQGLRSLRPDYSQKNRTGVFARQVQIYKWRGPDVYRKTTLQPAKEGVNTRPISEIAESTLRKKGVALRVRGN